ncbi:hypothetical protein G5714_018712 [Onychostoma macrolepis]|uniref:Uncharacterized protein n=1 Tax=Onychostoma macrolepis TaxID=369639 RepID=A0A7J6BZT7_9TELE|nr:hypothetical protein G5714_018712 [Onychostoma macrolepis]
MRAVRGYGFEYPHTASKHEREKEREGNESSRRSEKERSKNDVYNFGRGNTKVISKALPGLLEEKKEQLLQRLLSWGVESTDDLKYVEELLEWTFISGSLEPNAELRSAVANGKRPLPPDRRKMIRIIVDEIRKHEKNPSKAQCLAVALKIVKKYPKSFSDFDDTQEKNEIGYYSLLKQIKTRVEHVNRDNTLSRRRRISGVTDTPERMQCREPTATYGCTQWQPEPPLANSDDVLEEKRQTLENLYQRYGKSGADRSDVCALMKETYYLQRKHINDTQVLPIKDLKSKWPYLFVQKHIYAHFEELTSIAIHKRLNQAIQEYGKVLVDFFKSKPTNEVVKKILSSEEEVGPLVIKLILAHCREDLDGLLLLANRCATAADLQATHTIPGSPRLIVLDAL